jgi:NTE family protein
VDAARELGADFVIAVDISAKPDASNPEDMLGIIGKSITIMGRQLGEQELARADEVIHPALDGIGAADFAQKDQAIMRGEQAALAAIPTIRTRLAAMKAARQASIVAPHASATH